MPNVVLAGRRTLGFESVRAYSTPPNSTSVLREVSVDSAALGASSFMELRDLGDLMEILLGFVTESADFDGGRTAIGFLDTDVSLDCFSCNVWLRDRDIIALESEPGVEIAEADSIAPELTAEREEVSAEFTRRRARAGVESDSYALSARDEILSRALDFLSVFRDLSFEDFLGEP